MEVVDVEPVGVAVVVDYVGAAVFFVGLTEFAAGVPALDGRFGAQDMLRGRGATYLALAACSAHAQAVPRARRREPVRDANGDDWRAAIIRTSGAFPLSP